METEKGKGTGNRKLERDKEVRKGYGGVRFFLYFICGTIYRVHITCLLLF